MVGVHLHFLRRPRANRAAEALAGPYNHHDLSRVTYAYNWLADVSTPYLNAAAPTLRFSVPRHTLPPSPPAEEDQEVSDPSCPPRSKPARNDDVHGFDISPRAAGLPFPTGFPSARQSRHWRAGLETSSRALELFAGSAEMSQAVRAKGGKSLADVAAAELRRPAEDRFTKFATYLFPGADEARMRLVSAAIVFIIVFDDSWEMHEEGKVRAEHGANNTELQAFIDEVVAGLRHHDTIMGNGGQEVIDRLADFCRHSPPAAEFQTMDEYLQYRNVDAAVPFTLACTKFSIASSVHIEDPKLAKIMRLASDHLSLVNDLASFEKELRAYEEGKVHYLINAVDVMRKLLGLTSWSSAKAFTYAYQLEVESEMQREIENLMVDDCLDSEEWRFVEASLRMLAGNVFYSVVTSRYGGEAARIQ
ncbi:isoprenoid synthase domain-containing protein [Macrophomina phaseolina]|uniref:Isoprenoid synthase domain-containing protein n=1 Tax=Macrophomina phaseolina TaxID=35725 RepID=A0ABQ8GV33_9PEZI|nr:isoprenoid synthase domain-containing protein [Macrophomina phaseolina]